MLDIIKLTHRLKTQDNRITADPIFVVQEERVIYGIEEDYSDEFVYVDENGEEIDDGCDEEKVRILRLWQDVTFCFTERGAQEYINCNGHNHGGRKLRIYVKSLRRNHEMIGIRNYFLNKPWLCGKR